MVATAVQLNYDTADPRRTVIHTYEHLTTTMGTVVGPDLETEGAAKLLGDMKRHLQKHEASNTPAVKEEIPQRMQLRPRPRSRIRTRGKPSKRLRHELVRSKSKTVSTRRKQKLDVRYTDVRLISLCQIVSYRVRFAHTV